MRIYKYWALYEKEVLNHQYFNAQTGVLETKDIIYKFYGGSNLSLTDAESIARDKARKIQEIIDGNLKKDYNYVVDIREEVIAEIDEDNIITRNRYGALVLNSANTMFVDIDTKGFKMSYIFVTNILKQIMNSFITLSTEEKLVQHIDKIIKKYPQYNYRVYKTPAGYRVMVLGKSFDPNSSESIKLMKAFAADSLYAALCRKQNCYRARLTPKPHRINIKRHRVIFPTESTAQQEKHNRWVNDYHERSKKYAACTFLKEAGISMKQDKIVEYHDKVCNALEDLPIA